jgi:formylglycine-generating enzyme required for sulfatase activity
MLVGPAFPGLKSRANFGRPPGFSVPVFSDPVNSEVMPPDRFPRTPALWLRRLDFLPPWAAWALGLGGGALAGAALAGAAPGAVGVLGFLGLLGAAAGLAASGEPIAVLEETRPSPVSPKQSTAPSLVDLVEIPGGSFLMGSPEDEKGRYDQEGPVHQVWISSFACMRFLVTRRLYAEIVGKDPGWPEGEADDRPVNNVSWLKAVQFCNHLSGREGLELCYRINGEQAEWNRAADGYRLLTEAEWEYTCRAGTTARWSFGDREKRLGDHAWFRANSEGKPQPVGEKLPNAWGLHDMHGNVWEWCWDWHGFYTIDGQTDPIGLEEGIGRILRGGSFNGTPRNQRSAIRVRNRPSVLSKEIGFRCARNPRRQP